ncbi:MAG: zf-HC2 domain-containing protein [Deltaproteobacteria bacterium]|nr:zf-HC2 domain-containing protein [Deltaproteobacteria bacterium]
MDCKSVEQLLADWSLGRLDEETFTQIETHISKCKSCRALAEKETAFNRLLSSYRSDPPGPQFDRILFKKINKAGKTRDVKKRNRFGALRKPLIAATLASAAAAAAIFFFMQNSGIQGHPSMVELDISLSRDLDMYENLDVIEVLDALQDIQAASAQEQGGQPT